MIPTFEEVRSGLVSGSLKMPEVVRSALSRIEANVSLNVFVEVYQEDALYQASELQKKVDSKAELGKLAGCILSLKDVICQADKSVSAASKILEGFISPFSATVVERLIAEDAIIIGRTNCDEFAMGSDNGNSVYGPTSNAANPDHVPGGSSGAAAVSVQIGSCHAAIGSDTGGSVRQPAAFCGTYGFKPSYGRLSRHGLIAYASSFDQIGFLSDDPFLIEMLYDISRGLDAYDGTLTDMPELQSEKGLAILNDIFDPAYLARSIFEGSKHWIDGLDMPLSKETFDLIDYLVPTYYVLTAAEASSNLSRYDGVRYGYRAHAETLQDMYVNTRSEGFGDEVKRRIMLGTFVLSEGYYDAYYEKAQCVRQLLVDRLQDIFSRSSVLILPMTPTTAWKKGSKSGDPVSMYMADIFSVLANLVGFPAMSIPIGKDENGLPYGIQIMAAKYHEKNLFEFVKAITSS